MFGLTYGWLPVRNRIVFDRENEGRQQGDGSGAGDGGSDRQTQFNPIDNHPGGIGYSNEEVEDDNSDLNDLYEAFGITDEDDDEDDTFNIFAEPSGEDDESDESAAGNSQRQVQQLNSELRQSIQSASVPEDFMPEDFDPNDQAQMKSVMNRVLQQAMTNSLQLAIKVMQPAMSNLQETMSDRMKKEIQTSQSQSSDTARLRAEVPALGVAKNRKILEPMIQTLRSQGKPLTAQIKALKSISKQLNLSGPTKASGGSQDTGRSSGESSSNRRTGTDALASLFPNVNQR